MGWGDDFLRVVRDKINKKSIMWVMDFVRTIKKKNKQMTDKE